MTDWSAVDRFLATDPRDVGCEQALQILHVYVELVVEGSPAWLPAATPVSPRTWPHAGPATTTSGVCSPRPEPPRDRRLPGHAAAGQPHRAGPAADPGRRWPGTIVLDTTSALYVWEWPHYPQYYIPVADIDPAVLVDEQHEQKLSRGTARRHGLQVGET